MDATDSNLLAVLQPNLGLNQTITMRKRILLICIVVMALCAFFVFRSLTEKASTPAVGNTQTVSPPAVQGAQPAPAPSQNPNIPSAALGPRRLTGTEWSNSYNRQMQADWQHPIEFYGKVIDEKGNPVNGSSVRFQWSDMTDNVASNSATAESDAQGLFSLHGKFGRSLDVWVTKEGYYAPHEGYKGFLYSLGNNLYSPDIANPIIFKLRKKGNGESLITTDFPGFAKIAQLHHDGTPVELDLLKGVQAPAGSGQLKLEFWRDISNRNANVFDWKLQLSAPGGLVGTDEEFAFEVPESGYQTSLVIDMPATNQNWAGELRNKYYIQLSDGKYGRLDLFFSSFNGVFTVSSAINPSGSQNLEPAN
jgi:hypothetical protein